MMVISEWDTIENISNTSLSLHYTKENISNTSLSLHYTRARHQRVHLKHKSNITLHQSETPKSTSQTQVYHYIIPEGYTKEYLSNPSLSLQALSLMTVTLQYHLGNITQSLPVILFPVQIQDQSSWWREAHLLYLLTCSLHYNMQIGCLPWSWTAISPPLHGFR